MKRLFPALFLALVLLVFFFDILILGKTLSPSSLVAGSTPAGPVGYSGHRPSQPFSFDIGGTAWVNEPTPYLIRDLSEETVLPLWNPREGLGVPLLANLNNEILNPLKLPLNLQPGPFAQDLYYLIRLFTMGIFTCLFLLKMGLPLIPSIFGSVFFMISGYSVWWINLHPLSSIMYLPAVFFFYERWRRDRRLGDLFFVSAALSLAVVAGKIPDVVMGCVLVFLYAAWRGYLSNGLRGAVREAVTMAAVCISAAFIAGVAVAPFLELYAHASPLAKAIRTGASSHTLPLVTAVSFFQPLFLGWQDYFYGSWLTWTPHIMLPYAGVTAISMAFYAATDRIALRETAPFVFFSVMIFCIIFGIIPSSLVSRAPVVGSIEHLKYNSMLFFSVGVVAAWGLARLMERAGAWRYCVSLLTAATIVMAILWVLHKESPDSARAHLVVVAFGTLVFLAVLFLLNLSRRRALVGIAFVLLLIGELYAYLPKDHPERADVLQRPSYVSIVSNGNQFRTAGCGECVPPLVSGALGLNDIRAVSLLLQNDYYLLFQNLLSFSVPFTNGPSPLLVATSPVSDLLGVRYVLSRGLLERGDLDRSLDFHIRSLRTIRLLDGMVRHSVRGGSTYGIHAEAGEERFSFLFPAKFAFVTEQKIREPMLFLGFALKGAAADTEVKISVRIHEREEIVVARRETGWIDRWIDVSPYMGNTITIRIEGEGAEKAQVVLGGFGFSRGPSWEAALREALQGRHAREFGHLLHRGVYEGMHLYENTNVMPRAFVLHEREAVRSLEDTIDELQRGKDFRRIALVAEATPRGPRKGDPVTQEEIGGQEAREKVTVRKYSANQVIIDTEGKAGVLVLSDLFFPGWEVRVNGHERPMLKVFGVLRGVEVESGSKEVIFEYRPKSLWIGAAVSGLTLVGWIILVVRFRRVKHES